MFIPRFNPRARAGRDIRHTQLILPMASFNPRARAGRDLGLYILFDKT